jgi:streptogramin lyase
MLRSFAVRHRVARGRRPVPEGLEPRRLLAIVTTQFPIPGGSSSPQGVALGGDGNLWFTESAASKIGVFNPTTGTTLDFPTPTPASQPYAITSAPDGDLWFTELETGSIGQVNPTTHAITEHPIGYTNHFGIAADLAGNLWVANPASTLTEYDPTTQSTTLVLIPSGFIPQSVTLGPDGNIWFTDKAPGPVSSYPEPGNVGEVNPTTHAVQESPVNFIPNGIAPGPDGNLWFTSQSSGVVASINPTSHVIATYPLASGAPTTGIASGPGNVVSFGQSTMVGAMDTTTHVVQYAFPTGNHFPAGFTTGPGGNPWFINTTFGATGNAIGEVLAVPSVATTTTLSAVPNPSYLGAGVTITATVTSASGAIVDVAYVTIIENGLVAGFGNVVNGQATIHLPGQPLGVQSFVAEYAGGNAFTPSTSTVFNLPVLRTPTATALQVSPSPAYAGLPVTLTATVEPAIFTFPLQGDVDFFDGATPIGTAPVGGTVAQLTYTPTTGGTHLFVAEFLGDTHTAPSASPIVPETVYAATATTTTLYPSMNPVPVNQPLVLTATVTPTPGSGTPTGTVTFNTGQTVPLDAQGVATLVITDYTPFFGGEYTSKLIGLSAAYSGDATHEPSVSNTVVQFINPPDGPRITSLARTGSAAKTTGLVFTFDGPLHPATAQDTWNYVIVAANGRKIPVASAVYHDSTQSVTVTPRSPLAAHGIYIVTVLGVGPTGVTDVDGRLLDGSYVGFPGTNYSTVIVLARLRLASAVPAAPRVNPRAWIAAEMMLNRAAHAVGRRHG